MMKMLILVLALITMTMPVKCKRKTPERLEFFLSIKCNRDNRAKSVTWHNLGELQQQFR